MLSVVLLSLPATYMEITCTDEANEFAAFKICLLVFE